MSPKYKVRYFNFTGRAEPIRMILSYGNIQFEDDRISKEDWPKVKPTTPLGLLPILEIDGEVFSQSVPICRYVAKLVNLAGNDDKENLIIDIVVDMILDLLKLASDVQFESDEAKKKKLEEKCQDQLPRYLKQLEENAKKNGGYTALNKITWADIFFVCIYEGLMNIRGDNIFDSYPNLQRVKENVLKVDSIKEWILKRPPTPSFGRGYDLKQDL